MAEVRKSRRKAPVAWQDRRVEVSLDVVEDLGTFVELELMAAAEEVAAAKACIAAPGRPIGARPRERYRRSYLELLLGEEGRTRA